MIKTKFILSDEEQNRFYYYLQLDKLVTQLTEPSLSSTISWDLKENLDVCLQVAFEEYLEKRIEKLEPILGIRKEKENEEKNEAF